VTLTTVAQFTAVIPQRAAHDPCSYHTKARTDRPSGCGRAPVLTGLVTRVISKEDTQHSRDTAWSIFRRLRVVAGWQ